MLGKNIKGQSTHWPSIGKIAPNISALRLVELPHSTSGASHCVSVGLQRKSITTL
jgi:hypothetical protein